MTDFIVRFRACFYSLLLCLGGVVVATPALAEMVVEKNKILLGEDYSVFSLKKGERALCRQACEKDGRCQAWTFVKPGARGIGECRLKRALAPGFKNGCCVSGYKKYDFRNYGDDRGRKRKVERCDEWAKKAVVLNERNIENRCGYRGRAWHSNEDRHFRRCMQLNKNEIAAERRGQKQAINVCETELGYGRKARCDHYARLAVLQNDSRRRGRCGAGGDLGWNKNYKVHLQHCMKVRKKQVFAAQEARESFLQQCYAFDRARSGPCHEYAELAISHFRKNVHKGCDLHGPRWHNNYRRHVSACRRMSPKQRAKEAKKRRLTLKTCRLFGKVGIQWR